MTELTVSTATVASLPLEQREYYSCYMLPMGVPPSQRSGYGAVRYIGLTPPQVSSNEIIQYIIPDILKCSATDVTGVDP